MKTVLFVFAIAAIIIILILAIVHTYVRHAYTNRIITPQQASELNADCILVLDVYKRQNHGYSGTFGRSAGGQRLDLSSL